MRALISKLESGSSPHRTVPRIIESRCIEKTTERSTDANEDDPLTINSQLTESNRLSAVELISQVTVNNHISLGASMSSLPQNSPSVGKICRNKNVDLAMTMTKTGAGLINKTKDVKKLPIPNTIESDKLTTNANIVATNGSHCDDLSSAKCEPDAGVTNDARENKRCEITVNLQMEKPTAVMDDHKNSGDVESDTSVGDRPRMVKWGTWTKFDDKNYVANDIRLKQTPKYDDMEFEEFEVLNPDAECYDSLNS